MSSILINNINETLKKLNNIKDNIEQLNLSDEQYLDIQELLDLINSNLEVTLYKLDKKLNITNKTINERIKEYETEKKILEPFLPAILLYSMIINSCDQ